MIDRLILRQAIIQRYATGYADRMLELWQDGDNKLIAYIREWFADASDAEIQALIADNRRFKAVQEFTDTVTGIITGQTKDAVNFATSEMSAFAESEGAATAKILKSDAVVNGDEIIKQPVLGNAVATLWSIAGALWLNRVFSSVRDAAQNGNKPDAAIKGTKSQQYKDGAIYTRNNGIERDAETQVNGVANNARSDVYEQAGIKREIWLATLDYRACLRCGSLDGQVFERGKGPQPALHPRCRCLRVADTGEDETRPYVKDERSVKDIPKSERAGKIGQTKLKYADWFDTLPASAKREILGKTRYELYQSGDFEITDFINDRSRRILTIKELNDRYNLANGGYNV